MRKIRLVVLALFVARISSAVADSSYVESTQKWRDEEEADLKKPDGWLALAGLFWLKEGTNTIGNEPAFDVRLTNNFKQGKFGQIDFHNGVAMLRVAKGVEAQIDGHPVTTAPLVSDEKGKPTEVRTGSQTFYLIRREDRYGIRLKDSQSRTRTEFKGLTWFPIDETFRVPARLEAFPTPKDLMVPNVLGGHFKMQSPGMLRFTLQGKELALQPVTEEDGSLFIIFRDSSSGKETYGAGRFLHADKAINGTTVLDFNRAQNPPCAFTSFATCPLPPPGNDLPVAVMAGERDSGHPE